MEHVVFVYGTLLAGEANHRVLAGARFLGPAVTVPAFELVDLGPYPALVAGGETAVVGERYAVDDRGLARLDRLEGYPALYDRIEVALEGGERAIAYVMRPEQVVERPRLASGCWRSKTHKSDERLRP